jgi:hypothetical protein
VHILYINQVNFNNCLQVLILKYKTFFLAKSKVEISYDWVRLSRVSRQNAQHRPVGVWKKRKRFSSFRAFSGDTLLEFVKLGESGSALLLILTWIKLQNCWLWYRLASPQILLFQVFDEHSLSFLLRIRALVWHSALVIWKDTHMLNLELVVSRWVCGCSCRSLPLTIVLISVLFHIFIKADYWLRNCKLTCSWIGQRLCNSIVSTHMLGI